MMRYGASVKKRQRMVVIIAGLITLAVAVGLVLTALGRDSLSLFYQPSDLMDKRPGAGQRFRLGGLVEAGSFGRLDDGLTYRFRITDCVASLGVHYKGILPDLFREGQGIVSEGAFSDNGIFVAETVLAKHDENYAPPGTMPKNPGACVHPDGEAGAISGVNHKTG